MMPFEELAAIKGGPHQRAFSVMAVPSELNKFHKQNPGQQKQQNTSEALAWYQEIYKKYGYEPRRAPTFFGPYLLLQTLGEGEFAKVKAAVHVQTNQEVAIKLMRKDHIRQASLETKLEREISVLKSLHHPHIVQLFEVLTVRNYIGIVLQRAAGGELFEYILKHHYLQETEAKRLFAQLISGVHYMHQHHIVHRDLKLENLLLSKDRDIIITDFGFANRFLLKDQDLMATSCGSPCYAAPELVINDENSSYVGTAADIWSCGVILYAMLCGYLPFDDDPTNPQGANINALYKYIVSTSLDIPDAISDDASDLLRCMLVPDPKRRCSMDDIRCHPWLKEHWDILSADHMDSDARIEAPVIRVRQTSPPLHVNKIPESRENDVTSDEEMEEEIPTPPPSSSSSNRKSADSFQSKFITTLQKHINKIPEPQRRNRTTSEYYTSQKNTSLYPHAQQQTGRPSFQAPSPNSFDQPKSTSQKLIDWIRRIPTPTQSITTTTSTRYSRTPDKLTVQPIRAMPIGKPFGSYAADFNDTKLRLHRGAVDQDALTSKAPIDVLQSLKESLSMMGIEMKKSHDFKLKCMRPSKHHHRRSLSSKLTFFTSSNQQHTSSPQQEVIYGETGVDSGDEIQFTVELSKIENLPGLYVVDIRRTKGNIWAFKFLYHTLLQLMDLSGQDKLGYMAHRQQQQRNSIHSSEKS